MLVGVTVVSVHFVVPDPAFGEITPAASARRVYQPDEFQRFAPRTAFDMVRQIPGFTIREGDGARGFGQADTNVLINGRRISGKSNGPVEALGRIPASSIVRLEIVDGASLDISGLSGQVLNVVTDGGGNVSGRFRYSPQFRSEGTPFRWGAGEISLSGGGANSEWTAGFQSDQERFGEAGPEFVFDGDSVLTDVRDERLNESVDLPILSGAYSRTAGNGNVLNVTGEAQAFIFRGTEVSNRNPVSDVGQTRLLRLTEDEYNYELGADYEFGLGPGRLKLIGLYRYENSPTVGAVTFDLDDGRPPTGSVFTQQANEAEAVVRSEYSLNVLGGDWQWSVEGARNFFDIDASLEERDAAGILQPVPLPGASSRVEEDRVEMTLSYGRALSPRLQLQTSLGAEYSQIAQTGEVGLTRSFVRPKGFMSLNWKPADGLNVSARVERVVGQLSFFDFISSVNVNQERVNVSNINLVPPQSWLFEVELQQSFGPYGAATLRGYREEVSDIVDLIPIEGGGQAPGNITSASRYGASMDVTLLSDPTGWRGARLDVSVDFNDSEVLDPLLGTPRRISDQDFFDVEASFRQDFPGTDWAAGLRLTHEENSPLVRLDEVSFFQQSFPFGEVFIENKDVFGLTLRATVGNVFDRDDDFFRTLFDHRATGDIAFREERFRNFGAIFTFDIEGSF